MQMIRDAKDLLAREFGVTLFFHPHVGTCIETEAQIDRLLAETDVQLCFDTGHHAFWDLDVLADMARHWSRIGYMHLKNVDPAVRKRVLEGSLGVTESYVAGVMCPLPSGAVDIGAVMAFLAKQNFQGFCVVEQVLADNSPLSPEALAQENLKYLNALIEEGIAK